VHSIEDKRLAWRGGRCAPWSLTQNLLPSKAYFSRDTAAHRSHSLGATARECSDGRGYSSGTHNHRHWNQLKPPKPALLHAYLVAASLRIPHFAEQPRNPMLESPQTRVGFRMGVPALVKEALAPRIALVNGLLRRLRYGSGQRVRDLCSGIARGGNFDLPLRCLVRYRLMGWLGAAGGQDGRTAAARARGFP
jgi:hypothetical protein